MARSLGPLALILALMATACGGEPSAIPGLDPSDEIVLVEVEPDPDTDSYIWTTAYKVADLPKINVGRPTEALLEDAARVDDDPENYLCMGDASGSSGCSVKDPASPSISGITFGGPDTRAWSWDFVPEEAAAIRFTDQEGVVSWQRPLNRTVIFPDTVPDDPDGNCACLFEAVDSAGEVVNSVDLQTLAYVSE